LAVDFIAASTLAAGLALTGFLLSSLAEGLAADFKTGFWGLADMANFVNGYRAHTARAEAQNNQKGPSG
jgi:hypothetical protein